MRYAVSGRLRRPCPLSPAEMMALAIREWEMVVEWLGTGRALAYGRLCGDKALLLQASARAEAVRLAATLPFAPYADVTVRRADRPPGAGRPGGSWSGMTSSADPATGRGR